MRRLGPLALLWLLAASAGGLLAQDGSPRRYLLITRQSLAGEFQRLVDRRASQGFEATLVTVELIEAHCQGRDIQEKIRNYIRGLYDPSVPMLVALGGDAIAGNAAASVVPTRWCCARADETEPADLYYADMDGGTWDANGNGIYGEVGEVTVVELTPEVGLGRIPVRTPDDVRAYIDKVIRYEEAPLEGFANSMFYSRAGAWDGAYLTGDNRPADFRDHEPVAQTEVDGTRDYVKNIQPHWPAVPLDLFFSTRAPQDQFVCGDYDLTVEHFIEQLSKGNGGRGYHIIHHLGDSAFNGLGIGQEASRLVRVKDIFQLTNRIPGIVHLRACGVAGFDLGEPCIGEAFLRNPNGGAIAFFAPARESAHDLPVRERLCATESLYLGEIMKLSQMAGAPAYVSNPRISYIWALLGDPAIKRLALEPGRHVQVFQPSGGEVIDVGDDITIRWNAAGTGFGPSEKVKLEYSNDSGLSWHPIPGADALPYDGRSFVWQRCPLPQGTHYRIRVSCLSHPEVQHGSRRDFTITDLGLLTVLSYPNMGIEIGGTRAGLTDCTHCLTPGESVSLTAPEKAGDLEFQGWLDPGGNVLSAKPDWQFQFNGDTTVIASYAYPARLHYYLNDDQAEPNFAVGNDLNDGLSPQTPKRHINALLLAKPNIGQGDVIHLSAGVYSENVSLDSKNNGLTVVGAGSQLTVINGLQKGPCIHLVQCGPITIEDLCLTQGSQALYGDEATCLIADCELLNNSVDGRGGALWCGSSRVVLRGCRLAGNAAKRGAGVMLEFNNNVLINGCNFQANKASERGAAIYMREHNRVTIMNSLITGNNGSDEGGGVRVMDQCTVVITNCTFEGNAASTGSALYVPPADTGPSTVRMKNCIVWDGHANGVVGPDTLDVCDSDIQGGWPGRGNIDADPLFASLGYRAGSLWMPEDYHLQSQVGRWNPVLNTWVVDDEQSPCIDSGSADSDWSRETLPNGGRINMGAYGGTPEASRSLGDGGFSTFTPIYVPNGDFEDYSGVGDGVTKTGWGSFPSAANGLVANALPIDDDFYTNPSTFGKGWQSNGPAGLNGKYGLYHAKKTTQNDMSAPFNGDFFGVVNLDDADGFAQSIQSGIIGILEAATYKLTVAVAARPDGTWNDVQYAISLVANPMLGAPANKGPAFGSRDGTVLGTPAAVTLAPSTAKLGSNTQDLVYRLTLPHSDPHVGAPFAIRIDVFNTKRQNGIPDGGAGGRNYRFTQGNFDNVRLRVQR